MEPWVVVGVVVVVVVVAVVVLLLASQRRSRGLRQRFGPEYQRAVERTGDRRAAEKELHHREERRRTLDIKPLPEHVRQRYADDWGRTQQRFVDAPDLAVREANELVTDLMRDRGYPMEDFEQRAADVSVDHPEVVEDYRAASRVARASRDGQATTEDLRQAMVHFRALFDRLLETSTDATDTEVR